MGERVIEMVGIEQVIKDKIRFGSWFLSQYSLDICSEVKVETISDKGKKAIT
jgi:hypothetical protein